MTFSYRVDRWTDDGNSILDYVAAVGDRQRSIPGGVSAVAGSERQPAAGHTCHGAELGGGVSRGAVLARARLV
jgi:hypothetical protein